MNANDAHNKELYISARERHSIGRTNMTDAAIVAEQEKEINRYRNKIHYLEDKLHEKTVRIGDEITVEGDNGKVTFKLLECVVHMGAWTKGNVELCGVTKIGTIEDLSE